MERISTAIVFLVLLSSVLSEIDLRYLDETVDPCDDFFNFACGKFNDYNSRPANENLLDLFTITEDELVAIGTDILSSPKRSSDPVAIRKVKSAYTACVNVKQVDSLWYYQTPEQNVINEFGGMPLLSFLADDKLSWTDIGKIAGTFGIKQLFQFLVRNFDPETYFVLMFPEDSLSVPQMIHPHIVKTYDEVIEESMRKMTKPSKKLLNENDPLDRFIWKAAKHLRNVIDPFKTDKELQKDLNDMKTFMSKLFSGGVIDDKMIPLNSSITLKELQDWTDKQFAGEVDINWVAFYIEHFKWANINITDDFTVFLLDSTLIYGTLNLVKQTDPKVVKNYILFKTFLYMATDSDKPMREAFEEYYTSLGFRYYERSEYCARKLLDVVDSASLSFAIANDFVNFHFDRNKIPEAVKIINHVKKVFKNHLLKVEWLDTESRNSVEQKLDNIVVDLGYPDFVENKSSLDHFYDNVQICSWDHYGNSKRIRAFKQAYSFSQYLNHKAWMKSPFEVNAYAIRASNSITVPLAMLQSSFLVGNNILFDYSRFGSIISHEFVHHFDDRGILYNQDGYQTPLLTESTEKLFQAKLDCFVNQYNQYYVSQVDTYVNGSNTLSENIADNSGFQHAYKAFEETINTRIDNKNEKYSTEQQYFINYATGWCSNESNAYLTKLLNGNDHTPSRFRVIGILSNMNEFSKAFNCPKGSRMNPEIKCTLW